MKPTFDQKMQQLKILQKDFTPIQLISEMVEISMNFKGHERHILLMTIYEMIEFAGRIKGVQDLTNKILKVPFSKRKCKNCNDELPLHYFDANSNICYICYFNLKKK